MSLLNDVLRNFLVVYSWAVKYSNILVPSYQNMRCHICAESVLQLHFECQITIWNDDVVECHQVELYKIRLIIRLRLWAFLRKMGV